MIYRKIGGIHWFRIGRVRIAFCLSHQGAARPLTPNQPAKPALTPRRKQQRPQAALTKTKPSPYDITYTDDMLRQGIDEVLRHRIHAPF